MTRLNKLNGELCDALALPEEALGAARLTVTAGKYCLVENHRGILEYSDGRVTLTTQSGRISITGTSLRITAICAGTIAVRGKICAVEWE